MLLVNLVLTVSFRTRRCTDASLNVCFFASVFTWTIFHPGMFMSNSLVNLILIVYPDSPSCGWEHRLGLDTDIGGEVSPVGT